MEELDVNIISKREEMYRSGWPTMLLVLMLFVASTTAEAQEKEPDVIYVPTPDTVVKKMLEMADVGPGDYVVDLGSGDGRIVIEAAQQGAYGHGIEIDPQRLQEARQNMEDDGVEDRVSFIKGDLFEADFSRANVVTMYLLRSLNIKLRPRLLRVMEPGTPIVSHSFDMGDWEPDRYVEVDGDEIYLWYVPADVEGTWRWTVDDNNFAVDLSQSFQKVDLDVETSTTDITVRDVTLKGKRFSFIASGNDVRYVYSGKVEADSIKGMVQIHENGQKRVENWNATR